MIISYNTEKLRAVLDDFHRVTGISISICDTQLRPIAKNRQQANDSFCLFLQETCGNEACTRSDRALFAKAAQSRRTQIHRCSAGLMDMCVPLLHGEQLLGYMIMGRVRIDETLPEAQRNSLPPDTHERATALFRALPLYTEEKAQAAANLATMLTSFILTEGMILPQKDEELERVLAYIDKNLAEPLDTARICRDTHLSKSMLYRLFFQHMHCGVNQYITARRIDLSRELLAQTSLPVGVICERIGLGNYTYFCRLFKKKTGLTPLQYRKNQ